MHSLLSSDMALYCVNGLQSKYGPFASKQRTTQIAFTPHFSHAFEIKIFGGRSHFYLLIYLILIGIGEKCKCLQQYLLEIWKNN